MNTFKIKIDELNKVVGTKFDESELEEGWILVGDEMPQEMMEDPFNWIYTDEDEVKFIKDIEQVQENERLNDLYMQIASYQEQLKATDYVALKLAEAIACQGDTQMLLNKYANILEERQVCRDSINELKLLL